MGGKDVTGLSEGEWADFRLNHWLESSYIGLLGAAIGTAVSYVISIVVNGFLPSILNAFMKDGNIPSDFKFTYIPWYLTVGIFKRYFFCKPCIYKAY